MTLHINIALRSNNVTRAAFRFLVDPCQVIANETDGQQSEAEEETLQKNDGSPAPNNLFGDQRHIGSVKKISKRKPAQQNATDQAHPQRQGGKRADRHPRKTQHLEERVLCLPGVSRLPMQWDNRFLQAQPGHQSAHEAVLLPEVSENKYRRTAE